MRTVRDMRAQRARTVVLGVIAGLLFAGVVLRIHALPVAGRTPDERTYTAYATQIHEHGLGTIVTATRAYIDDPAVHVLPPPTRFGFNVPGAIAMLVTGHDGSDPIAWLSTLASVAMLGLVAYFAYQFLSPWIAIGGLAFLVASPVDLAMARRAWGDEMLAFTAFAMLLALVQHRVQPRGRVWGPVALALGVFAVWQKETGVLVLAVAGIGYLTAPGLTNRERLLMLRWAALAGVVTLGGLVLATGGLGNLVDVLQGNTRSVAGNEYAQQYQMGGPMYYVRGFAVLHAIPIALGCIGVVRTLIPRRHPETMGLPHYREALTVLSWFVVVLLGVALFYSPKNLRYVSVVYAPLYLLAAAMLYEAVRGLAMRRWGTLRDLYIGVAVLLAMSAVHDYQVFDKYFVQRAIPDLATPWFTGSPNR
jgi:hypothetical protein